MDGSGVGDEHPREPRRHPPGGVGADQDALDELGALLLRGRPLDDVLSRLTELVAATVPGADVVSLTVTGQGGARTAASSGRLARDLDEHQYATGTGPCLDAARRGTVVRVPDTTADATYPAFAAAAHRRGVRSTCSVALPARRRAPGALNLYRVGTPHDVDAAGEERVGRFASFAAVALVNAEDPCSQESRVRHLHVALHHRVVLDQATGVVMAQESCGADRARDLLRARARREDRPLLEVATSVLAEAGGGRPPGAR